MTELLKELEAANKKVELLTRLNKNKHAWKEVALELLAEGNTQQQTAELVSKSRATIARLVKDNK